MPLVVAVDSVGYHPSPDALAQIAEGCRLDRVLLVAPRPRDLGVHSEFRVIDDLTGEADLNRGIYWFRRNGLVRALVKFDGEFEPASESPLAQVSRDEPAVIAMEWLDLWWPSATPVPAPHFKMFETATHRPSGRDATVRKRFPRTSGWEYEVTLDARQVIVSEDLLVPIKADAGPADWLEDVAEPNAFGATLTKKKLQEGLTDTLFSYGASRTMFLAYQFKAVLRYLDSASDGILIADEVGLGKTISAGLLWTEMAARGNADRVLVVCPSSLVEKWELEMQNRFNFDVEVLTAEGLERLVKDLRDGKVRQRYAYICSLERLRRFGGLDDLNEAGLALDLAIVDEAHQMRNAATASYALGSYIRDWSDQLLFLSATPLNLGNTDLLNLVRLLSPADVQTQRDLELRLAHHGPMQRISSSFLDPTVSNTQRRGWLAQITVTPLGDALREREAFRQLETILAQPTLAATDIPLARSAVASLHGLSDIITRTRKAEVEESRPMRVARPIKVPWTQDEHDFYDTFQEWAAEVCRRNRIPSGFALQMPLRQAGSCLPVLAARIRARSFDEVDEDVAVRAYGKSKLDDEPPSAELVALARRLHGVDSKFEAFLPELRQLIASGRQAIIFTFSRGTLAYLARRLEGEASIAVLHGGIPSQERGAVMDSFRAGREQILVATKVASEGLDFEFCSVVINYDLPWNPMEVEQRIGRIDRLGQREKLIHIWNFETPGTIETRIVQRLLDRIGIFRESIGELEPILGDSFERVIQAALRFTLTSEERAAEFRRAEAAFEQRLHERRNLEIAAPRLQAEDRFGIEDVKLRIAHGRFVGGMELARLLAQWAAHEGGTVRIDRTGRTIKVTQSRTMLEAVVRWRRQSGTVGAETTRVENAGRTSTSLELVLDQELARTTGGVLLNVNHPLVQTAMHAASHRDKRFTSLRLPCGDCRPGQYVVLFASVNWHGLRPTREIWTQALDLSTGRAADDAVGARVMTALTEGALAAGPSQTDGLLEPIGFALEDLRERRSVIEVERRRENDALTLERELRAKAVFERKRADVLQRMAASGSAMTQAFQGQIRKAEIRYADELQRVDESRTSGLDMEVFAACTLELTSE